MSRKRSLEDDDHDHEHEQQYQQYQLNIRPDDNHIWLDGKLIVRPTNRSVSFGILLYKKDDDDDEEEEEEQNHDGDDDNGVDRSKKKKQYKFKYLLGLIPQGNAWTVFKGMPDEKESPEQTAIREFREETSISFPYDKDLNSVKVTTLYGRTSKKLLEIYLVEAPPNFCIDDFDIDQVVKINNPHNGYMDGKPEIIHIQFLSKDQAVNGTEVSSSSSSSGNGKKIVKIYKSQIGILEHAEEFLQATTHNTKK